MLPLLRRLERLRGTIPMKRYTCTEYRLEMMLLGLTRKLNDTNLEPQDREKLKQEIQEIERQMGLQEET
uniref:Uncharacterized protein n=1 Tax=Desulfatirhabdium butyrativorans TaxID=340467 RepID=A0A7C4W0T7_9BACT